MWGQSELYRGSTASSYLELCLRRSVSRQDGAGLRAWFFDLACFSQVGSRDDQLEAQYVVPKRVCHGVFRTWKLSTCLLTPAPLPSTKLSLTFVRQYWIRHCRVFPSTTSEYLRCHFGQRVSFCSSVASL